MRTIKNHSYVSNFLALKYKPLRCHVCMKYSIYPVDTHHARLSFKFIIQQNVIYNSCNKRTEDQIDRGPCEQLCRTITGLKFI